MSLRETEKDFNSFWEIWLLHRGHSGLFEKDILLRALCKCSGHFLMFILCLFCSVLHSVSVCEFYMLSYSIYAEVLIWGLRTFLSEKWKSWENVIVQLFLLMCRLVWIDINLHVFVCVKGKRNTDGTALECVRAVKCLTSS